MPPARNSAYPLLGSAWNQVSGEGKRPTTKNRWTTRLVLLQLVSVLGDTVGSPRSAFSDAAQGTLRLSRAPCASWHVVCPALIENRIVYLDDRSLAGPGRG